MVQFNSMRLGGSLVNYGCHKNLTFDTIFSSGKFKKMLFDMKSACWGHKQTFPILLNFVEEGVTSKVQISRHNPTPAPTSTLELQIPLQLLS